MMVSFHEFRVFVEQTMNDEPEKSRHPKVTAVLFQVSREDGKTTIYRDFRLLKIPWAHRGRKWLHPLCNEIPIDCKKADARRCTCSESPVKSCDKRPFDRGFLWMGFRCRIPCYCTRCCLYGRRSNLAPEMGWCPMTKYDFFTFLVILFVIIVAIRA